MFLTFLLTGRLLCRNCSKVCWKAETMVQVTILPPEPMPDAPYFPSALPRAPTPHPLAQMIFNNDVNSLTKYVERKNDCNLHTCVLAPLTMAAAGGEPQRAAARAAERQPWRR